MSFSYIPGAELAKLPKWAQNHICAYEREIHKLQDRVSALESGAQYAGTKIFIRNGGGENPIPLPRDSVIRFVTGEHYSDFIDISFDRTDSLDRVDDTGQALKVMGEGIGAISVIPSARNVLFLRHMR